MRDSKGNDELLNGSTFKTLLSLDVRCSQLQLLTSDLTTPVYLDMWKQLRMVISMMKTLKLSLDFAQA